MDLHPQSSTFDGDDPAHARLDALLRSEPAPRAPLALTRHILAAVAARRAHDLAWARRQVLTLVAAAVALVVGLGATLGWSSPAPRALTATARADLDAGLSLAADALASLGVRAERLLDLGGAVLPGGPPLAILVVLGSALLLFNQLVCRGWRPVTHRSGASS